MPPSDWALHAHSPGSPHFFEPGGNPLIFLANSLEMKGEDTLGRGHRDAHGGRTVLRVGHVLHSLQVREAPFKIGQAAGQDRLSLWHLQQVEEGDTGKKLGFAGSLRGGKIPERGLQQLDAALGQLIEMPIGLAFLGDDLPGDSTHLFKALEDEVERFVVESNHAPKRPVNILFDLVAMPWALPQHGED